MPEFEFISLLGNSMKLDGGSMFGNAPRALWERWLPADERNMICIASRILLVKTRKSVVLFETGAGAYLSPEMKKRFQVQEAHHVLLASLADLGIAPESVTHVILSHLHFDHAGGLLKAYSDGQNALAFPNALVVTGRNNFDRAQDPHIRDRASFIPGLTRLLEERGRLLLKNGGEHMAVDGMEIEFIESQGHTPGMLLSLIRVADQYLLFTGDLVPGHHWINLPITMGYDRYPERLVNEKQQVLKRAMELDALLVFPHDPEYPAARLGLDPEKQRFFPVDLIPCLDFTV